MTLQSFTPAATDSITGLPASVLPVSIVENKGGEPTNPSTIYSAQQTMTTGAVAAAAQALSNGIVITALTTNTGTCYVGPSGVTTANGYPLAPGQSISYGVSNASAVYLIGTNTTDKVALTGN